VEKRDVLVSVDEYLEREGLTHSNRMGISINGFPAVFGSMIHLMADAEMRVRLCDIVPPLPDFLMEWTMGKFMKILHSPKVGSGHHGICRCPSIGFDPCSVAEVYENTLSTRSAKEDSY
jgi:hypothetical protein